MTLVRRAATFVRQSALPALREPIYQWMLFLAGLMAVGVGAALVVFVKGLGITNLTDLVPWGLWISVDLSAIALAAGAFSISAIAYLARRKELQPVAKTAVYVGFVGYSIAMMMLLLDIGRPDRFWHGFVFWNIHSPLWEVTMCVGLYFSVLMMEVMPIIGHWGPVEHRFPSPVAPAGFVPQADALSGPGRPVPLHAAPVVAGADLRQARRPAHLVPAVADGYLLLPLSHRRRHGPGDVHLPRVPASSRRGRGSTRSSSTSWPTPSAGRCCSCSSCAGGT
jgi:hypothetical protein